MRAMSISPTPRATDRCARSGRQRPGSRPANRARKDCPYVFPADVGRRPLSRRRRDASLASAPTAKIEGVTPHTLRHTFGSVAGDLGFSELTIAALLGHAARGVTQGYVHIDEALKLAATRTCEEIASLWNGGWLMWQRPERKPHSSRRARRRCSRSPKARQSFHYCT